MGTTGWEHTERLSEKYAAASGRFVRLSKDGDKVVGVFVGAPYAREMHWDEEKYAECTGQNCPFCVKGKNPVFRVVFNFYVLKTKSLKIIEGGNSWYKDVVQVRDKYGLERWSFEVKRHGQAAKTSYSILPEQQLSETLRQELAGLELYDLPQILSGDDTDKKINSYRHKQSDSPNMPSTRMPNSGAIPEASIQRLVPALKALPPSDVDIFLEQFGIRRVRDLKASDERRAWEFINSLAAQYTTSQGQTENDPFAN